MSRGHDRERAVKRHLESQDWWVARAAGSLGDADLVAAKAGARSMLIEVKSTAGGPYERFGPADRARLLFAAQLAGADAVLAWWPPRGKLRFIPSDEWPTPKQRDTCECGADAGDIHFDRSYCVCGSMHHCCNQCGALAVGETCEYAVKRTVMSDA